MSDQPYYTGEYSYYENAKRMAGGDAAAMFPEGWGMEGETPEGTIRENAIQGLWLPVFIPEGADGYVPPPMPSVILYAAQSVPDLLTSSCGGEAHASPEVDECRYQKACELGLESCTYTSGSPYVREA